MVYLESSLRWSRRLKLHKYVAQAPTSPIRVTLTTLPSLYLQIYEELYITADGRRDRWATL